MWATEKELDLSVCILRIDPESWKEQRLAICVRIAKQTGNSQTKRNDITYPDTF